VVFHGHQMARYARDALPNTQRGQTTTPQKLASGGNDNHLLVWDARSESPLFRFLDHEAAVKAIAWSPHQVRAPFRHAHVKANGSQRGLLVSGGGTADRAIRFWNTLTGSSLCKIDTGSQV
jgi:cell division cycle 20-like protein 1 (cofactor of APC complex)